MIEELMRAAGWLADGERVLSAEKAGEGNMNSVLRVQTTVRSVILKQSRPWVVKYPHIPAPVGRILVEAAFYRHVRSDQMPRLLGAYQQAMLLEDLSPLVDFAYDSADLIALTRFLESLHRVVVDDPVFDNRDMRRLNHEHIFDLPLSPANGLGYDALAAPLWADTAYCEKVRALGEMYLARGPVLVHGDFFPGSWLKNATGVKVIDPEFCFYGPPEFDLGVMLAHLVIARADFDPLAAYRLPFDAALARQFAGVEVMRRLIGVAQLPIALSMDEKAALLRCSRELVG